MLNNNNPQVENIQEPAGSKDLMNNQPKLKKIKTRNTIIEQKEDEDLVYEKIKDSRFKQQRLPAWRPVPTIISIIIVFASFGLIFIILGIIVLVYSKKIKSQEYVYDDKNHSICQLNNVCKPIITIKEKIEKPVYLYYQLDGFYQNSRRYLKSKNVDQLRGLKNDVTDCEPAQTNEEMNVITSLNGGSLIPSKNAIPCGLVAKTFFNDTFKIKINNQDIKIDDSDIAFEKDRDLFKKNIDISDQWHDLTDQHFLVWMRPSGLPNPRKLYGKIDRDLDKGEKLEFTIENNYDVSKYDGKKKIILSNANALGGKNKFLGVSYIVVGCLSIVCAVLFPLGHQYQLKKEKEL